MVSGLAGNLPPDPDWGILRQYPPIGIDNETQRLSRPGGVGINEPYHGFGKSYSDTQIRDISKIIFSKELNSRRRYCFAGLSQLHKWVILQQATRGCTAAVTAMLIMDLGGTPDLEALMTRNLGTIHYMIGDIKKAGFIPVESQLSSEAEALKELQGLIAKNGSIIVGVNSGIDGHVVVVDDITADGLVCLRDPYHGWEIAVGYEDFLKSLSVSHPVLQALRVA